MIEVMYYNEILQLLEKIQKNILSRESILKSCVEKWGNFSISPFKYDVIGSLVHKIDIANGYLYEEIFAIFLKSIKDGSNNRYEILEECQQQHITQTGFDVITMEETELERDVDLLFRDLRTNVVYFFELRRKCNQDSYKRQMTVRKFKDTTDFIKNKYGNVISKIIFIEEDKKLSYGNIEKDYLITGKEFFKDFLNSDISKFFEVFEQCKKDLRIENSYKYIETLTAKFEEEAIKYGPEIAREKLLGITKVKNGCSFF